MSDLSDMEGAVITVNKGKVNGKERGGDKEGHVKKANKETLEAKIADPNRELLSPESIPKVTSSASSWAKALCVEQDVILGLKDEVKDLMKDSELLGKRITDKARKQFELIATQLFFKRDDICSDVSLKEPFQQVVFKIAKTINAEEKKHQEDKDIEQTPKKEEKLSKIKSGQDDNDEASKSSASPVNNQKGATKEKTSVQVIVQSVPGNKKCDVSSDSLTKTNTQKNGANESKEASKKAPSNKIEKPDPKKKDVVREAEKNNTTDDAGKKDKARNSQEKDVAKAKKKGLPQDSRKEVSEHKVKPTTSVPEGAKKQEYNKETLKNLQGEKDGGERSKKMVSKPKVKPAGENVSSKGADFHSSDDLYGVSDKGSPQGEDFRDGLKNKSEKQCPKKSSKALHAKPLTGDKTPEPFTLPYARKASGAKLNNQKETNFDATIQTVGNELDEYKFDPKLVTIGIITPDGSAPAMTVYLKDILHDGCELDLRTCAGVSLIKLVTKTRLSKSLRLEHAIEAEVFSCNIGGDEFEVRDDESLEIYCRFQVEEGLKQNASFPPRIKFRHQTRVGASLFSTMVSPKRRLTCQQRTPPAPSKRAKMLEQAELREAGLGDCFDDQSSDSSDEEPSNTKGMKSHSKM